MNTILVLYANPDDPTLFDTHYSMRHVPLVNRLPGLRKFETSVGPIQAIHGESPYHLAAFLTFDSRVDFEVAMASDAGKAVLDDTKKFSTNGFSVLVLNTQSRR